MFDELAELIFDIHRFVISRPSVMSEESIAANLSFNIHNSEFAEGGYGSHDQTANRIQSTI
jgi:hypothetical protein